MQSGDRAGPRISLADARAAGRHEIAAPPADLDLGVIYTYEREFVEPLLTSLAQSGDGLSLRLILVDNASDEGVGEWSKIFPRTTVVRNERRQGYAENLNRILDASTAPMALLLNTDMVFEPREQTLTKLVRFMRSQPDCGLCGCRLYHPDGDYAFPARRFQTLRLIAARRGGMARWFPGEIEHHFYRNRDRMETFDCDWLSGCLMMVRRQAIDEVGRFDTGFRKYFEDVDICLRMGRAGWRVMFHGQTYAYHCEQRASRRLFSQDAWRHVRSYLRWLGKWGWAPHRHLPAPAPRRKAA